MTTSVYIEDEQEYALNFDKRKNWFSVNEENFVHWAKKAGIAWRAIKPHINDTMEKVRALWPKALDHLPMDEEHKSKLREHWLKLHSDFRIE
ncbi:MAG: hypothetical protein Q9M92_03985 [Enterobacterales bacterium]|nr:hypothetical protein [Enterobacterales bacterium]